MAMLKVNSVVESVLAVSETVVAFGLVEVAG